MKLVFDTETTGLTKKHLPVSDPSQPRVVQLGAILFEDDGTVRAELNLIVKPDGWTIPVEASNVHGITTELAEKFGLPLDMVLRPFNRLSAMADTMVAHNFAYDEFVLRGEFERLGREPEFKKKQSFCTMEAATPIVGQKGPRGLKWPKLIDTHEFLFGEKFEGAHDAMADVRACKRVFLELVKRNS